MKRLSFVFLMALLMLIFINPAQAQNWVCKGKTGCTAIGGVCSDGTIFAGCTDNNIPIYTTRCGAGQTWNGSACTGALVDYAWNSGTTNYTTTSLTGTLNGSTNTATLVTTDSDNVTGGTQAHNAAAYCDTLTENGRSDWYLPAAYELWVLFINYVAIGNLATNTYWSSSEYNASNANNVTIGTPPRFIGYGTKNLTYRVRCVRRD